MSSYYRNPTANAAMGAVDAQIRALRREADRLARLKKQGRLSPQEEARARRKYTGIFRRIWLEAME